MYNGYIGLVLACLIYFIRPEIIELYNTVNETEICLDEMQLDFVLFISIRRRLLLVIVMWQPLKNIGFHI